VNPLIDVAELARALASADPPTLLDVRWSLQGDGRAEYAAGHVPGAAFVDLDADLSGEHGRTTGRHPLPDPETLQAALRRLGVRTGHPVVVYDAGGPQPSGAAARAWWILRWAGHDNVRVLDGGYAAWLAAGRPVTDDAVEKAPGDVTVRPGAVPVIDADGAAERAAAGALVDARVGPRYRGETEPIDPVAGHIPGAVNQPAGETVGPDGRLLDPDSLRDRFESLGLPDDQPVGAYCGSGVAAAHTALALQVAGYEPVLYVGSWSHWITDPDRPVATGARP
jgi:thiosulfate/3-mercaptopyruvate sulfurtransferase